LLAIYLHKERKFTLKKKIQKKNRKRTLQEGRRFWKWAKGWHLLLSQHSFLHGGLGKTHARKRDEETKKRERPVREEGGFKARRLIP